MESDLADPWMKFYPADWRSDPRLKMVSRAARSLWLDMICLMHEAERYGDLTINGQSLDATKLAAVVGDSVDDVSAWLQELADAGVYSVRKNGTIYSRRMERDENKRRKNRENGKKGGIPSHCKNREIEKSVNRKPNPTEARSQKPDTREDIPPAADSADAPSALDDDRTKLFREGLDFIKSRGIPESKARPLIGRCLKNAGDDATAVLEVLRKAYRDRPAQLEPWLLQHFRAKPKAFDRWARVQDPNFDPFAPRDDEDNVVVFGVRS